MENILRNMDKSNLITLSVAVHIYFHILPYILYKSVVSFKAHCVRVKMSLGNSNAEHEDKSIIWPRK